MHTKPDEVEAFVELDALSIWSTGHGTVGVMNGACIGKLDLPSSVLEPAMAHAMDRMGQCLHGAPRPDAS